MRTNPTATSLIMLLAASSVIAGDTRCETCLPLTGDANCHSCADNVCVTYAQPGTTEKHCWKVECEEVCIPAIRWPWQCGGESSQCDSVGSEPATCGRVRVVRRLRRETFECDVCEYEHRIECRCPSCCAVVVNEAEPGTESQRPPSAEPDTSLQEPAPAAPPQASQTSNRTAGTTGRRSLWARLQSRD